MGLYAQNTKRGTDWYFVLFFILFVPFINFVRGSSGISATSARTWIIASHFFPARDRACLAEVLAWVLFPLKSVFSVR